VSSTAVSQPQGSRRGGAWAAPSRLVAALSGTPALIIKIAFLAIVNAVAVYGAIALADNNRWPAFAIAVLSTLLIDVVYLTRIQALIPLKFLLPGTIFLVAFQIVPIVYNVNVAFTNYSTGHLFSKEEAITAIQTQTLEQPANGKTYTMAVAKKDGKLTLILKDDATGNYFAGDKDGLTPLSKSDVTENIGIISAVKGYELVKGPELLGLDRELSALKVPSGGNKAVQAQGLSNAVELEPTLRYDAARDQFVRISDGKIFTDNGRGSFTATSGQELEPGWKTYVGTRNFSRVINDPLIRKPFLRVLLWTFVFAFTTVVGSFFLGLFLAIALDKKMRMQKVYRTALIIPYAIPGFLSLLVWKGLLNDDFGIINQTFHTSVPWLFDPWWARFSVIFVSIWLTFPYFFLVSMGALQSVPAELTEAARVDGARGTQVFRRVTLPLLLIAVAPLMIASFAFNFNNFNNIYLLTQGGPAANDQSIAGSTDILISYTYKLAFEAGKGNDYALASAVSIVIFFLVALMAGIGFWRAGTLEDIK
jgi:arabinogalactan oligomer/maltooligosaccharide transport system permease protein